jgi:hypothetical protein
MNGVRIVVSLLLSLIGLKSLANKIDPNLDMVREVNSSIFVHNKKN